MGNVSNDESYRTAQQLLNQRRYAEALAIYEDLAKAGDPQCQVYTGWMYYEGLGVTKDTEKALGWFDKAASLGSKEAAFYSGRVAMSLGQHETAIKQFRAAARQEYGPALLWLGIANIRGLGLEIDLAKGIDYLTRAAKTGNHLAQRELAFLMIQGKLGISKIPVGLVLLPWSIIAGIASLVLGRRTDQLIG
jgi:hypothetical protein